MRLKGGVKLPAVHTPAGSSVEQMFFFLLLLFSALFIWPDGVVVKPFCSEIAQDSDYIHFHNIHISKWHQPSWSQFSITKGATPCPLKEGWQAQFEKMGRM